MDYLLAITAMIATQDEKLLQLVEEINLAVKDGYLHSIVEYSQTYPAYEMQEAIKEVSSDTH